MTALRVVPRPAAEVHWIGEDHDRGRIRLGRAGTGFHESARNVVDDPAVIVGAHERAIRVEHIMRDASQFGGRQPRIDASHLERPVEPRDVFIQTERLMPKCSRGLRQAVAEHHGAVEDRDFGLRLGYHCAREVNLTLLS